MNVIVVGSGPAGVSVAKGLLEQGCEVTLLDVGNTLEPEKKQLLFNIQQSNSLTEISSLQYHANAKKKIKLPYNSNFIYKGVTDYFAWHNLNCHFQPSFAEGGLSNVWGSAVAEYSKDDLCDWPGTCRDLSFYYAEIISWLDKYYNTNTSNMSRQASYLKNCWKKNITQLKTKGFSFDSSTLAVDFRRCRFCGLCQYGCPYELIYHSSIHLLWLKQQSCFNYIKGVVVEKFSEENHKVSLFIKDIKNNEQHKLMTDRLFIACGTGLSSLLYLRSLNEDGRELKIKDSQHFILPCLIDKPFARKGVTTDPLHALCQLKLSLSEKHVSKYPVYFQLYTYMDLYKYEIKNKLKWIYPFVKHFFNPMIEKFIVLQGYLDPKESNQLIIQYQKSGEFIIKDDKSKHKSINTAIQNILVHLKKNKADLGFTPLRFLLSKSLTGQSNHINGSLMMSENPKDNESDIWGRPSQFNRVHFVDGSILPDILAGPITLTIMANAYRIGKEVPL